MVDIISRDPITTTFQFATDFTDSHVHLCFLRSFLHLCFQKDMEEETLLKPFFKKKKKTLLYILISVFFVNR